VGRGFVWDVSKHRLGETRKGLGLESPSFECMGVRGLKLKLYPQGASDSQAGRARVQLLGPEDVELVVRFTIDGQQQSFVPVDPVPMQKCYNDMVPARKVFESVAVEVLKVVHLVSEGVSLRTPAGWATGGAPPSVQVLGRGPKLRAQFQDLLDATFQLQPGTDYALRTTGKAPRRLMLDSVHRVEHRGLWDAHAQRMQQLHTKHGGKCCPPLEDPVATTGVLPYAVEDLRTGLNVVYLFMGIDPTDAFQIPELQAKAWLSQQGDLHVAECSSQADECSQEGRGKWRGCCAMLLCRVVLGTPEVVQPEEVIRSRGDSRVVGPVRKADSYRSIAVPVPAAIYPEFIIVYRRVF